MSFNLEVKLQPNHSPILSGLKTYHSTLSLSDLQNNGTYNFGPLIDPEIDDTVSLTYTVQPAIGNTFFSIDYLTGLFKITDMKGLIASTI